LEGGFVDVEADADAEAEADIATRFVSQFQKNRYTTQMVGSMKTEKGVEMVVQENGKSRGWEIVIARDTS
jgi:hypothetical protein